MTYVSMAYPAETYHGLLGLGCSRVKTATGAATSRRTPHSWQTTRAWQAQERSLTSTTATNRGSRVRGQGWARTSSTNRTGSARRLRRSESPIRSLPLPIRPSALHDYGHRRQYDRRSTRRSSQDGALAPFPTDDSGRSLLHRAELLPLRDQRRPSKEKGAVFLSLRMLTNPSPNSEPGTLTLRNGSGRHAPPQLSTGTLPRPLRTSTRSTTSQRQDSYWLEDSSSPISTPICAAGHLRIGCVRPTWNNATGTGRSSSSKPKARTALARRYRTRPLS